MNKWTNELNRVSKEETEVDNKYEESFIVFAFREMQIKTAFTVSVTPV